FEIRCPRGRRRWGPAEGPGRAGPGPAETEIRQRPAGDPHGQHPPEGSGRGDRRRDQGRARDQRLPEQPARQRHRHDDAAALELATMPSTVLSTLIPSASLTGVGFAFTSYDKVWAALDGEVGKYIRGNIEKVGLVPFEAMWDNGFRQITSSTKPINTPDDLKNFKIRVPVVPLWVALFSAFGAAPVSIPLNEAYSALQTKIADGQENPLALIEAAKFYEVQKYPSLTNHSWDGFWGIASARVWKTVPKELQEVMAKHLNAAAKKQRDDIVAANAEYRKNLESKGLVFNTTKAEDFQAALAKTSFYKDAKAKFGDEAWTLLQKYAGNI